ncbi:secondary thiamine-phosphate synthase enzyme YjbQ [Salinibacter altiplanensis]|uniref:secondary thiamine-phosphate synthase enzyme YjbQ n=1 Tax=Salinibacter altiplanensis TaxID=1803181 RepID=UPI000C9F9A3B|nr:secondary thiamine-phosphate synthase enzyme YjbQ [Salinibacter altiplanensis]
MEWRQTTVRLAPKPRGFHLVTDQILEPGPRLDDLRVGLLHVFLQHTSASLTINENAAPAVRGDMERHFDEMVPEAQPYYEHTVEGPDDMPAHIKASMLDTSLSIPIQNGQPAFGTWQGIYLNEHRNNGGARSVVVTIRGETV